MIIISFYLNENVKKMNCEQSHNSYTEYKTELDKHLPMDIPYVRPGA